jgi:hypothetical protein
MTAGKYYIGDLCYVMDETEWDEFCGLTIDYEKHTCNEGEFTFKDGRRFAVYNTKFGDGLYFDQFDREYSVDAGSIGCFKVEDIRADKYDDIETLGNIVEFGSEFVTGAHDGTLFFGDVKVYTNGSNDE